MRVNTFIAGILTAFPINLDPKATSKCSSCSNGCKNPGKSLSKCCPSESKVTTNWAEGTWCWIYENPVCNAAPCPILTICLIKTTSSLSLNASCNLAKRPFELPSSTNTTPYPWSKTSFTTWIQWSLSLYAGITKTISDFWIFPIAFSKDKVRIRSVCLSW